MSLGRQSTKGFSFLKTRPCPRPTSLTAALPATASWGTAGLPKTKDPGPRLKLGSHHTHRWGFKDITLHIKMPKNDPLYTWYIFSRDMYFSLQSAVLDIQLRPYPHWPYWLHQARMHHFSVPFLWLTEIGRVVKHGWDSNVLSRTQRHSRDSLPSSVAMLRHAHCPLLSYTICWACRYARRTETCYLISRMLLHEYCSWLSGKEVEVI